MTATLLWQDDFPLLRLEGPGARDFLQGQTSADLKEIPDGVLVQSCWLSATGRLRGLLEIRMDPTGADVLVLAHCPIEQEHPPHTRCRLSFRDGARVTLLPLGQALA